MGESQKQAFQLSFNRFLRVTFHGSRVTSNGGLILVRELDERLGFGELVEQHLTDSRANNARVSFISGPGVAADRFGEDLGSRGGSDFSVADLRDGDAG